MFFHDRHVRTQLNYKKVQNKFERDLALLKQPPFPPVVPSPGLRVVPQQSYTLTPASDSNWRLYYSSFVVFCRFWKNEVTLTKSFTAHLIHTPIPIHIHRHKR